MATSWSTLGNENDRRNGVGVLLSKECEKSLIDYKTLNSRIMSFEIKCKPINITTFVVYAPTSSYCDEDADEFYDQLQDALDETKKRNIIMICGDFNAKIGKGQKPGDSNACVGNYGLGLRNDREQKLIEFCEFNDLCIGNSQFVQHPRRLFTWTSPNGMIKNQIDFILIENRWKSSMKKCKTYPGADCGSDHQLLFAEIKVKLKNNKFEQKHRKVDLDNIGPDFNVTIRNRFSVLLDKGLETRE